MTKKEDLSINKNQRIMHYGEDVAKFALSTVTPAIVSNTIEAGNKMISFKRTCLMSGLSSGDFTNSKSDVLHKIEKFNTVVQCYDFLNDIDETIDEIDRLCELVKDSKFDEIANAQIKGYVNKGITVRKLNDYKSFLKLKAIPRTKSRANILKKTSPIGNIMESVNPVYEPVEEYNLLFSKDKIELNIDKWLRGEYKILYITGYSGSGKTTISNEYESKYKDTIVLHGDYFVVPILYHKSNNPEKAMKYGKIKMLLNE